MTAKIGPWYPEWTTADIDDLLRKGNYEGMSSDEFDKVTAIIAAHAPKQLDAEKLEEWMKHALPKREPSVPGFDEILKEVQRATVKFPTWPTDPLHALAVLGEEFGELTKAMLQHTYEPEKSTLEDVHEEAIQTAAMALRLVKSLNVYEYRKGFQHVQAILNREQEK